MRIAHILRKYNPAEWGGTETALRRTLATLHPRGVRSILYAPHCQGLEGTADPLADIGCDIRRFRACVPIAGLSQAERQQIISVGGNLMSFDLPWMLWREPDLQIMHSHALGRIGGIALTIAKARRLPFVVTIHGGVLAIPDALRRSFDTAGDTRFEWGRAFGLLFNSRRLFSDADAILTCNEKEAELLREKYPRKRIQVQPHGVPLADFATDQREAALAAFPPLRGKDLLLVPGRIDPVKNQHWVVEHSSALLRRYPRAMLALVGACTDKQYGDKVNDSIRASGMADRILMTGGLPPGDSRLIGLFQNARAVILPSLSETFGLVVLEGWAAGAGVIASRTPGATALIRHGKNGWLFDLDAPSGFEDALHTTMATPNVARDVAAAGHRLATEHYDSAVLAARLEDLYVELCQQKTTRGRPAMHASVEPCPELAHR